MDEDARGEMDGEDDEDDAIRSLNQIQQNRDAKNLEYGTNYCEENLIGYCHI